MQTKQVVIRQVSELENLNQSSYDFQPQLILIFADQIFCADNSIFQKIQSSFPNSKIVGCSTAGEISDKGISEKTIVLTLIKFDKTIFQIANSEFHGLEDSFQSGQRLAEKLPQENLKAIFILGQGVNINGSLLIDGIRSIIPKGVLITGGLAADNGKFEKTYVIHDQDTKSNHNIAIGFYGDHLVFSHGSFGGWQSFGPARKITKSNGNILAEIDDQPALELYKKYLGKYADELPASALLYPLSLISEDDIDQGIIRTILGIDHETKSLILAGDIPETGFVKLMHANTNLLVEAAEEASRQVLKKISSSEGGLTIMISCVGRKLVMGERTEEEIETVRSLLGKSMMQTGFYSNGEISPHLDSLDCKLHNQTMTITYINET
ncbi:MAG: FIST N-terminal domain-containing protein [Leptospiraceae bacterium]|nr:FIST N-terminal domain-containing protein [Leptospiraceae bacterium]